MVKLQSLILLFLVLATSDLHADVVPLVRNGKATSVIVLGENPSAAARQASADLQMWLRRISGAEIPVAAEGMLDSSDDQIQILVGDTKRTRTLLGAMPDSLELEELVVRSFPDALVLTGDDIRADGRPLIGTQLAVNAFVEEILGVRMLWPGELGEIVPRRTTIEVQDIDIRRKPLLLDRDMGNHGWNGATHPKLDALGWDREAYRNYAERDTALWFRFHQLGGSYNGYFGHAYGHYWKKYSKEHPEWFAMQPDGTRDNSEPEGVGYEGHRLCVSNPDLIRHIAEEKIRTLKNSPTLDAVSVSPNDGGRQTFCLCPKCESWDSPDAPVVSMRTRKGRMEHVSFSDRFVRFYSEIAKIVSKEIPDRWIGAYAYSVYKSAPMKTELHPRVVVGFVPGTKMYFNDQEREETLQNWENWSKKANKLFLRPNYLMGIHAMPSVFVHRLGEDMAFFADHGMLFARQDCHFHHWATNGLNYYVMAKLLWDPYADVDPIIDDYCRSGFGPAAEVIRKYFDRVEQISIAIAAERRRPEGDTLVRHFTDEVLAELHEILNEATTRASYDTEIVDRVAFLRKGLEYAPICRDYVSANQAADVGDKWDWRRFTEQSVRRASWFQELGPSRAIHAPWLIYWDW